MAGTGFANLVLSEVTKILGWRGALSICGIAGIILALSVWTLLTSAHRYRYPGQLREQGTPPKPNRRRLWQSMQVVLATKEMWLGGVFSACTFSVLSAFVGLWGVPFLMLKYDLDVVGVTSVLAMVYLGVGASSPLLGWLASRVRMRLLMTVGTALCFVSLLFVLYSPNLPLWMLYILMFKLGFTCSVYQLSFTLVCQSVPDYCQGVAIGTTNMITMISAPVLQPIIGIFLSMSHGSILDGFETYSLASYQKALLVLPIVYALGFVIAFFFKEKLSGDNEQLPEANYSGH
jgi:MFS family permease